MTKPIGYYTNYAPGQEGLLADMQETWGSSFEKLNEAERAWMIYQLGYQLWQDAEGSVNESVELGVQRAQVELKNWDKLGLVAALVDQIKGG